MCRGQVTITSVIIFAIVFTAITYTIYYSYNMLEYQAQQTEFELAKNNMIYLAELIDKVAFSEKASNILRINVRTVGINFIQGKEISLKASIDANPLATFVPLNIEFKGGNLIGLAGFENLLGNESYISVNDSIPLEWVYTNQSNGAWIICSTRKFGITPLGSFKYTDAEGNEYKVFMIEIKYIILSKGSCTSTGTVTLVVKNNGISTETKVYSGSTSSVTFEVYEEGDSNPKDSYTIGNIPSDVDYIVITITRSVVEISCGGG